MFCSAENQTGFQKQVSAAAANNDSSSSEPEDVDSFHKRVDELLVDKPKEEENEIVIRNHDYEFSHSSLQRLRPQRWLNDEIINAYLKLVKTRFDRKIHVFDSFFYTTCVERKEKGPGIESLRHLSKNDYLANDLLFCPIHVNNNHWTLIAVHIADRRIEYYDSLNSNETRGNEILELFTEVLQAMESDESEFKEWTTLQMQNIPRQDNDHDCGVFMCQYALELAKGGDKIEFSSKLVEKVRREMVYDIDKGELMAGSKLLAK